MLREYVLRSYGARMICRPRRDVAKALDISERQVSKAIQRAKEAGLIVVVSRGIQGRTAVDQGAFGKPKHPGSLTQRCMGSCDDTSCAYSRAPISLISGFRAGSGETLPRDEGADMGFQARKSFKVSGVREALTDLAADV